MKLNQTKIHFIGVGGVGMSALAQLYHQLGAQVSGSDSKEGRQLADLRRQGIEISVGHAATNLKADLDVVVYSSAIPSHNAEMQKARELKIPIIPRAEALAELMRFKRGIAVGGTHGKTTTTSMISAILLHAGLDPTIAVGGRLKLIESTARLGKGPWLVAEADESDGSFSRYQPEISIITNIDSDHLDHFGHFENLQKAFYQFASNVPFYGAVVICGDDPRTRELFTSFSKKIFFYGQNGDNDFVLKHLQGTRYAVIQKDQLIGEFELQVPGRHNALNALAAAITCHQAGVSWPLCFAGLNTYSGVDRRFQLIGQCQGVPVYDDYAHHPTEIAATIQAARESVKTGRIHLVYQPHRYTRTRDCWQDYLSCFQGVDSLYLVDIYPAGESPLEGVSSSRLATQIVGTVEYSPDWETLTKRLRGQLQKGDLILTMGAGDIWQLAHQLTSKNQS